ncbi:MAG: HU family DNA-binding protein, partial [Ottowia sp.]|nr:HU family DNA-binding protein [Ottowia sp.]
MTKAELIEAIAKGADISKSKAEMSLNAALDSIKKTVA